MSISLISFENDVIYRVRIRKFRLIELILKLQSGIACLCKKKSCSNRHESSGSFIILNAASKLQAGSIFASFRA